MKTKTIPANEVVRGDLIVEGEDLRIVGHIEYVFGDVEIDTEDGPRVFKERELVIVFAG